MSNKNDLIDAKYLSLTQTTKKSYLIFGVLVCTLLLVVGGLLYATHAVTGWVYSTLGVEK